MLNTRSSIQPTHSHRGFPIGLALAGGILFSSFLLAGPATPQIENPPSGREIQNPNRSPFPPPTLEQPPERTAKQKDALVKYNFKQMKKHADQLSKLAQSLQKNIDQSNENVLSLDVVRNAEKIEKLAKKIKNEAKGY
jgi:hypothetical protein